MTIFNKKLKPPKPRSSRLEFVEKRPAKKSGDEENISLDILDNGIKIEFMEGNWTTSDVSNNKRQPHTSASLNSSVKAKDEEIRMITAKYDILLDLLTELTLNDGIRPWKWLNWDFHSANSFVEWVQRVIRVTGERTKEDRKINEIKAKLKND